MEINNKKYELIKDEKNGFDIEVVTEKLTDYYDSYDYIVGDWAYGKLRMKGFNNKNNKNYKKINDYALVDKYIKEKCAYGCRYFIIKKI